MDHEITTQRKVYTRPMVLSQQPVSVDGAAATKRNQADLFRMNDYESIQLDKEWIILNTDAYSLTKLNGVGGFCWSMLHTTQTVSSISDAVRKEFQFVDETVEADIEAFLQDLIDRGLVQHT
ncbi:PqqD family protein [Paenibacillus roseipurpureus]|uniref:PqqD family protein n=1 Tax=Paenibacillus roseopurpureus TaxID=2918901 RepID=A0AA96LME8_9BACL|nr:PqqD family protein [Paenibacillus sp. MBLB1832]WNR43816.1 PqqD family protein [Paenibacillus sp. MBLB1832]